MTEFQLKDILKKHKVYSDGLFKDLSDAIGLELEPLEKRRADFIESLRPYVDTVGREEINKFFKYWSEVSTRGRKMRFEKEKTFEILRRLETWMRNSSKFKIVNMLKR